MWHSLTAVTIFLRFWPVIMPNTVCSSSINAGNRLIISSQHQPMSFFLRAIWMPPHSLMIRSKSVGRMERNIEITEWLTIGELLAGMVPTSKPLATLSSTKKFPKVYLATIRGDFEIERETNCEYFSDLLSALLHDSQSLVLPTANQTHEQIELVESLTSLLHGSVWSFIENEN